MERFVLFAALLIGNVISAIAHPADSQGADNNVQVNIGLNVGHPITSEVSHSKSANASAGGFFSLPEQTLPFFKSPRSRPSDELDEETDIVIQCPAKKPIQRTSCRNVHNTDKDVKSTDHYHLVLTSLYDGTQVMCDTETDQGGWTVFQMRTKGNTNFERTWGEYKYGFGDFEEDFWFGLEKIHKMTTKARYELRIDMKFEGNNYFARYSHFRVWGEAENYKLEVGHYSGNSSNDLGSVHNNMAFSTPDRDNDKDDADCADQFKGGWWYASCHKVNVNGVWGNTEYAKGLTWHSVTGYNKNLNWVEMKMRPY